MCVGFLFLKSASWPLAEHCAREPVVKADQRKAVRARELGLVHGHLRELCGEPPRVQLALRHLQPPWAVAHVIIEGLEQEAVR